MKIVLVLLASVVLVRAGSGPGSIEISGSNTDPAAPPTEDAGNVVESDPTQTRHRARGSDDAEGMLLPKFCPYPDKDFPSCGSWTQEQPGSSQDDCMRVCKDLGCDRALYDSGAGRCRFHLASDGDPEGCEVSSDASNLQSQAGSTLLVRMTGGQTECAGGVGPTGLPEDDFSSEFCEVEGGSCDVTGFYTSKFKGTVWQCKTECNSKSACAFAIWTVPKDPFSEQRTCYLFANRDHCAGSYTPDSPGRMSIKGNELVRTVSLYRLTMAEYRDRNKGPTEDSICPPGLKRYKRDMGPPFTNKFCIVAKNGICPPNDGIAGRGLIYSNGQNFNTREACMNKCAAYPTCVGTEFTETASGNNRCNMRDGYQCQPNEVVETPGVVQEVRIRLDEGQTTCPAGSSSDPKENPWNAKFCIAYNKVCPENRSGPRETTTAADLKDCLTQCHNKPGCRSATFKEYMNENNCEVITGKCAENQLEEVPYKKYYIKVSVNQECPKLTCPPNSEAKFTAACPDTCANPTASQNCDISTERCVCVDGFLELDGQCIPQEQCPVSECPEKEPAQPQLVADGTDNIGAVYRFVDYSAGDVGSECGDGATIQVRKPCPNTADAPNAEDNCPITEALPSCHCTSGVWDSAQKKCVT